MISTNYTSRGDARVDSKAIIHEQTCLVQPRLEQMIGSNAARLVQQIYFWLQLDGRKDARMGEIKTRYYRGRKYANIPPAFFNNPFRGAFRAWSQPTIDRAIRAAKDAGVLGTEKLGGTYNSNWYCVYDDNIAMFSRIYDDFDMLVTHEWNAAQKNDNAKLHTLPDEREREILDTCKKHIDAAKKQAKKRVKEEKEQPAPSVDDLPKINLALVDDEIEVDFWAFYQIDRTVQTVRQPTAKTSNQVESPVMSERQAGYVNLQEPDLSEAQDTSINLIESQSFIVEEQQQRGIIEQITETTFVSATFNSDVVAAVSEAGFPPVNSYDSTVNDAASVPASPLDELPEDEFDAEEEAERKRRELRGDLVAVPMSPEDADALIERFGVGKILFEWQLDCLPKLIAQLDEENGLPSTRREENAPRPRRAETFHPDLAQQVLLEYEAAVFSPLDKVRKLLEIHGAGPLHAQFEWAVEAIAKKPEHQRHEDSVAKYLSWSFNNEKGPMFKDETLRHNLSSGDTARDEAVKAVRERVRERKEAAPPPQSPPAPPQASNSGTPSSGSGKQARARLERLWQEASPELRAECEEDAGYVLNVESARKMGIPVSPSILHEQALKVLDERLTLLANPRDQSEGEDEFEEVA